MREFLASVKAESRLIYVYTYRFVYIPKGNIFYDQKMQVFRIGSNRNQMFFRLEGIWRMSIKVSATILQMADKQNDKLAQ